MKMIEIKIGILLDACGICYTENQLTNLEALVNIFIQQNIDKTLSQDSSYNFKGKNVVENVIEQKEFTKTDMKAIFDEESDVLQSENIALECRKPESVETDLNFLEEDVSEVIIPTESDTESDKNEFISSSILSKNVKIKFWQKALEVEQNEVDSEIRNKPYLEELDLNQLSPVLKETSKQNMIAQNENDATLEDIWGNWQDFYSDLDTKEFYCPVPIPKCAKLIFESKLLLQLHKKVCHEGLDDRIKITCPLCKHKPVCMYTHLKLCEPIYKKVVVQGCPKCGKKFKFVNIKDVKYRKNARHQTLLVFKKHMKLHELIKCDICQESFPRSELKGHMIAEHQENPSTKKVIEKVTKKVIKKNVKKRMKKDPLQLICQHCTKQFTCSSHLQLHIDRVHLKIKNYPCKECDKAYTVLPNLKHHMSVEHSDGNAKFQCDNCGEYFLTTRNLKLHKETHDAKILKCMQCIKMFSKQHRLDKHVKEVHGAKEHCLVCDKYFTRKNYESHMNSVHLKVKQYSCKECEKAYSAPVGLKYHMSVEHGNDNAKFQCEHCTKQFKHSSLLQKHINSVHLKVKQYSCKECEKAYKSPEGLQYHMSLEHGDGSKKFQCEDCGKCFLTTKNLRSHKERSHDAKILKCGQCIKMFDKKHRLDNHVREVHGAKDHRCLDCNNCFTKKNYERHMKTVHTKNFQCDRCEKSFGTNQYLLEHIANKHDGIKSYKCTLCPDSFASKVGLQKHTDHCHDLKRPFICSICSQAFKLKEHLDHHVARKHELRNCETCPYCAKQFSRLSAHKLICPSKVGSHVDRPRFMCPNCDKVYLDKGALNRHLKILCK